MDAVSSEVRLADLLAALSVVTDLGIGRPPEAAMRSCLLAARLAERMNLPTSDRADVYYGALLRYIGCTAYAHEEAMQAGGDEIAARTVTTRTDYRNLREAVGAHSGLVVGAGPLRSARAIASLSRVVRSTGELVAAHCEVGTAMARRLGMSAGVHQALEQIFERWDGKGFPRRLAGENLCIAVRVAHVATQIIAFVPDGRETVEAMVRQRRGGWFDPAVADCFLDQSGDFLDDILAADAWLEVLRREPEPARRVGERDMESLAEAFADMADLKLTFTRGHSRSVSEATAGALRLLGSDEATIRRGRQAALFHDIGRIAVPNGIWETPGPLTSLQWEQVRLHPYHTERILSRSPALTELSRIAGMHHERQDGSGYYRQLAGAALPLAARVLAAADVYSAMTEERPHRPAFDANEAASRLIAEAREGLLDREATNAVLATAGHRVARRRERPAGLSEREVEVLRLIARGASYRDVAQTLVISPRTAAHHVQHIYDKIGVSSRAAAAMFAMEHDLLTG